MASLVLKPVIPNLHRIPDLTAVSNFPRNIILINPSGMFPVSTNEVICHVGAFHPSPHPAEEAICSIKSLPFPSPSPQKRCPGLETIFALLLLTAPSSHLLPMKTSHSVRPSPSVLPVARWSATRFISHSMKPIRPSNSPAWIPFLTHHR